MIGEIVDGRYRIERQLGIGGMGAVYEAVHTGTHRRVALKVILGGVKKQDVVIRFQREARAAGSVDTQHIVQVFDTGTDARAGVPYMVMELLVGEDVLQLVRRLGPMAPDIALRIVAQACLGLQKAHEAGVVHRDIKSANLFLAQRDGGEVIVKLLDFGIAKVKMDHLSESQSQGLTQTGSLLGSPLYMSPEQAMGYKSIDHRTDVWSLGAVLYETLAGRTPHAYAETLGQLIMSVCTYPAPPVQSFAPWVAPEIAAIVHRALAIHPDRRFASAQAMLEAIRPLLAQGASLQVASFAPLPPELRTQVAPVFAPSPSQDPHANSAPSPYAGIMPPPSSAGGFVSGPSPSSDPRASASSIVQPAPSPAVSFEPSRVTADSGSAAVVSRGASVAPPALGASHPTQPGFTTTARRGAASSARVIALIGALVLGAGVGYKFLFRPKAEVATVDKTLATANTAKEADPPARPATSGTSAAPLPIIARLLVSPADAVVEVDGKLAAVKDGAVEVTGTPGSEHAVRLRLGSAEKNETVFLTEKGETKPARIEITDEPPKAAHAPSGRPFGPKTPPQARTSKPATGSTGAPTGKPADLSATRKWED